MKKNLVNSLSVILVLSLCQSCFLVKPMEKNYISKTDYPTEFQLSSQTLIITSKLLRKEKDVKRIKSFISSNYNHSFVVLLDSSLSSLEYKDTDKYRYELSYYFSERVWEYTSGESYNGLEVQLRDRKFNKVYKTKMSSSLFKKLLKAHLEVIQERDTQ